MKPSIATEQNIPLNCLIEWNDNPRKTRNDADVVQMAASLAKVGQQAPLIVFAADGDNLFKTIEGETRRRAFNLNATNELLDPDAEIRCWVMPSDASDEQLLSVALAANTVRREMNPIEEMEAFHNLAKSGLKLSIIAEMFAVEVRTIRQRLALGDLVESARDLVREGKRQMGWAQAMTLGNAERQERIVDEIMANPGAFPDASSVKAELTRGHIPVSSALFDPAELADTLVCDLFNQDGDHFTDVTAFWDRQYIEIQKKIDELNETHAAVKFVDRTRFDDAGWTAGGVMENSTAVIIAYDDGSVEVRECMMPPAVNEDDEDSEGAFLASAEEIFGDDDEDDEEADEINNAGNPNSTVTDDNAPAAPVAKIEVNPLDKATKETTTYLVSQVSAALKLAAASDPRLSMAFVVASTLTRRGPSSSMQIAGLPTDTAQQTAPVFGYLQNKRAARDRIVLEADVLGLTSPAAVVQKLMALEDGLLEQLFAYTVADSIVAGLDIETASIFDAIGGEALAGWQIEASYLSTLSNAQVRALALQVVKLEYQPSPRAARGLVEKAILESVNESALTGNFMSDENDWMPPQVKSLMDSVEERKTLSNPDPVAQAA